jgi:hypothetical protein
MTRDDSLWPLANALNTLLTRFQRSYKAEKEFQHLQMMIPSLVNKIQAAEQSHQSLPLFSRTSTSLDPLLLCLSGKNVNTPTPLDAHFRE